MKKLLIISALLISYFIPNHITAQNTKLKMSMINSINKIHEKRKNDVFVKSNGDVLIFIIDVSYISKENKSSIAAIKNSFKDRQFVNKYLVNEWRQYRQFESMFKEGGIHYVRFFIIDKNDSYAAYNSDNYSIVNHKFKKEYY